MTENKQFTTASSNFSHHSGSSYSQPYRFGGRVGLFGHYLRSLKIILLLTCIKLDATTKNGSRNPNSSNQQSQHKVVDHILKGICDLASSIEAVERKYVKKGQRLLFCGPDLISLGSRCIDLQRAFDALHDTMQGKQTIRFAPKLAIKKRVSSRCILSRLSRSRTSYRYGLGTHH